MINKIVCDDEGMICDSKDSSKERYSDSWLKDSEIVVEDSEIGEAKLKYL